MIARPIRAILFDKDGTLVDFQRTWGPAVHAVMQTLAAGRRATYERLAAATGFVDRDDAWSLATESAEWADSTE